MTVGELIAELQKHNPNLAVGAQDGCDPSDVCEVTNVIKRENGRWDHAEFIEIYADGDMLG